MFEELMDRTGKVVARRPGLVVLITGFFIFVSLISSSNLKFGSAHFSENFPPGDRIYIQSEMYSKDFGLAPESSFIFIKGDNVINRKTFEYMLKLQENLEKIEGIGGTASPASIIMKIYGDLPADELVLKKLTNLYASSLLPKPSFALISIQIEVTDRDKQMEVAREIENVLKFTPSPAGVTVEATGGPVVSYQITQTVSKDIGRTTSTSILLMVFILFLTFSGAVRKKYTAFMPLIISLMSVIVIVGIMPVLGILMTDNLSATLPILIGLAIEYAAQIQNRYEEERMEGKGRSEAVSLAVSRTGLAVIMAMLTTIIGFMSMAAPRVPTLFWFGTLMSFGLVVAYVLSITFLPASLKLMDRMEDGKKVRVQEKKTGVIERALVVVSSITTSNPRKILFISLVLIVVGAYASTQVKLETDLRKYAPQDLPALVRYSELERTMGAQYIFTVVFTTDEINAYTLEKVDEVSRYIMQKEDMVYKYDSLQSLIKEFLGRLPEDDRELSLVMSRIPAEQLKRYVSGNQMAVYLYTTAETQDKRQALLKNLEEDLNYYRIYNGHYITGLSVIYAHIGEIMVSSMTLMTMVAYVLIVALLFGIYRSIRRAVVPLVAITTTIAVVNIFMYAFGIKQTMVSIALNSITLGLGIDFSIHITERYMEERRNFSPVDSVRRTVERTGKAIVTSGLTMAGGFGALSLSTFPVLANFGFLAFVAIIFSLISALTIVPAFLMVTERFTNTNAVLRAMSETLAV